MGGGVTGAAVSRGIGVATGTPTTGTGVKLGVGTGDGDAEGDAAGLAAGEALGWATCATRTGALHGWPFSRRIAMRDCASS